MRALFDDLSVLHDDDLVRVADGRKAVGDYQRGAALQQLAESLLDELVRVAVDVRCCFVEHEDARIRHERTGKTQ